MDESRAHQMALPAGYQLEQYRIEAELGHGGFGITYRALDTHLDRQVAIKEYLPRELAYREAGSTVRPISQGEQELFEWGLERFLDEGRTLAQLDHPAIIRVHSLFRANETAYLVMEYCEGEPLERVLEREGRLSPERVQSLAETLLSALEALHKRDVIHRDIKPANIFLRSDGSPVLLDFGSARQAVSGRSQSITAVVSPHYAAFEQYSTTSNQGPWTDLYGLAATLYQATTGQRPPEAPNRIESDALIPAQRQAAGQGYPESLLQAIDAALVPLAQQRLQSVEDWRRLMTHGGSSQGVQSTPPQKDRHEGDSAHGGGKAQPGGAGKTRLLGWAAAAVLMVSAGGVGFYQYEEAQAEDERLWTEAQEADTREAYEDYLAGCPERLVCEHEAEAEQALAPFQEREEARVEDERREIDSFHIGHGDRYIDNGDGTVTDRETGLMWMRCALGQTWRDRTCEGEADTFEWDEAMDQEGHRFAGYDDWRLPDIQELKGLVYCSSGEPGYRGLSYNAGERCGGDYDRPTIDEIAFPNTPASYFWSASPSAGLSGGAWYVLFYSGFDGWNYKSLNGRVRLVRGGQ